MALSQKLQQLEIKLERAEQEIQIMKLEKIEYEKEIEQLAQQNQALTQENDSYNDSYNESCQFGTQQMQFLRKQTADLDIINNTNNDLHTQINEYKKLVKTLQSENINLQTQNENYETLLETLAQKNEIRENVYSNTALQLQHKIKQLENENDTLTQELNDIKLLQTYAYSDTSSTHSETEEKQCDNLVLKERNSDIINIKSRRHSQQYDNNYEKPLFFELNDVFDSNYYSEESVLILKQLLQFGYNENDILNALNEVNNKNDINEIVESIEKKVDCKCDMDLKMKEMEHLKNINNQSKLVIDKLTKKIKLLREKNQRLHRSKKVKENESCFSWWGK